MEVYGIYILKMLLSSVVLLGYYQLFLKDKTFHQYNRFYLLSVVLVSLLLPLLQVKYFVIEVHPDTHTLLSHLGKHSETDVPKNGIGYWYILLGVTLVVSCSFLFRLVWGIMKINAHKRKFQSEKIGEIAFYQTNLTEAPFSFFKNIFWKESISLHSDLGQQILKHEMVHVEQNHSWDKIFMEVICSIFWWNPLFWYIRRELSLIHEYLADHKAVENDTKAFAQMLLASHFAGSHLSGANPLLYSNLKKRLKMITQKKTKYSYIRRVLALPVLFAIGLSYMIHAKNKDIKALNETIAEIKSVAITPQDTLRKKQREMAKLDKKISKKIEEINNLEKENAQKMAEFKQLNKQLKAIDDEKAKENQAKLEEMIKDNDAKAYTFGDSFTIKTKILKDGDGMKIFRLDEEGFAKVKDRFPDIKWDELKEVIEKSSKRIDSKEFKEKMESINKNFDKLNEKIAPEKLDKILEKIKDMESDVIKIKKVYINGNQVNAIKEYYIGDTKVTEEEFNKIAPNEIKSVTVNAIENGKEYILKLKK